MNKILYDALKIVVFVYIATIGFILSLQILSQLEITGLYFMIAMIFVLTISITGLLVIGFEKVEDILKEYFEL
jgi:hypothetical protein